MSYDDYVDFDPYWDGPEMDADDSHYEPEDDMQLQMQMEQEFMDQYDIDDDRFDDEDDELDLDEPPF